MPQISYQAIPTKDAEYYRSGGLDANGQPPEHHISDGAGLPCRHCLNFIVAGDPYLILAYRPFPALQPYAETGPIFIHAEACERYENEAEIPPALKSSPNYILRGYGKDDRIVYGTGAVTPIDAMQTRAEELLKRKDISYVHVRSAQNNCYQARITKE